MQFFVLLTVGLIFALSTVYSELITFTPKDGINCVIKNVRLNPCTLKDKICVIPKNSTATLTFDYTPGFSSTKPINKAFILTTKGLTPFSNMGDDACKNTKCPITANKTGKYKYSLPVLANHLSGTFSVVMRLWDSEETNNVCDFIFNIIVDKN